MSINDDLRFELELDNITELFEKIIKELEGEKQEDYFEQPKSTWEEQCEYVSDLFRIELAIMTSKLEKELKEGRYDGRYD